MKTIERLISTFDQHKDQVAVIHNGNAVTYSMLKNDITRLAGLLYEMGISSHERVLVLSSSKYQCLLGIYAIILAGAVAVPLSPDTTAESIKNIFTLVDASIVVCDNPDLLEGISIKMMSITGDSSPRSDYTFPEQSGDDPALILLTSGTSGDPKATELTHANLLSTSLYINEFMKVDTKLREYICIPIHHSFGFARTRCILLTGGTILIDDGLFHPTLAIRQITRHTANAFSGVPAIIALLVKFAEQKFGDLGKLIKYVEIGSAPMPHEHKLFLLDHLPEASICMHYGLTEASRASFINFRDEKDKLFSVGKPSPGVEIRILGESDEKIPAGKIGEIVVSGPNVASGYVNDPVQTGRKFVDRWFHTGDSGYIDEQGYLYFMGRQDDLINMGGKKISPAEIERYIAQTGNSLKKFCIVGIPDPEGIHGEIPALAVEDPLYTSINFKDLLAGLIENKIPDQYLPRKYFAVDQIPRTHNGKVRRKELVLKLKF